MLTLFATFGGSPRHRPRRPDRGRSLAIRHVDAGSCNGCEHELTLSSGPTTTCSATGWNRRLPAPRRRSSRDGPGHDAHAVGSLLTAYEAMPEPRRVVALGDCALGSLGCSRIWTPKKSSGRWRTLLPVDLRIPGCPPTPELIAAALLSLIDKI